MGLPSYFPKCKRHPKCLHGKRLQRHNSGGQTLAEYALIVALISVVAIGSLMAVGGQVSNVYTTIDQQLNLANSGGPSTASRSH